MIHCLQYDGQQANNADADKNPHIFAHCLNNEIWVETNEGQKTEGCGEGIMDQAQSNDETDPLLSYALIIKIQKKH